MLVGTQLDQVCRQAHHFVNPVLEKDPNRNAIPTTSTVTWSQVSEGRLMDFQEGKTRYEQSERADWEEAQTRRTFLESK